MLMTCQCRLADCDKYATPVRGVDSGEAVHVSGQGVCENSIFSAQLCYEPKTVLKYIFKNESKFHVVYASFCII